MARGKCKTVVLCFIIDFRRLFYKVLLYKCVYLKRNLFCYEEKILIKDNREIQYITDIIFKNEDVVMMYRGIY